MLLTLADTQDAGLYDKGRDAFLKSIRQMGLGMLSGRQNLPELGTDKIKYDIDEPDEEPDKRTIDAKAEEIRRIFERVKKSATAVPPEIVSKTKNFTPAKVHFQDGKAELDDSAKEYLTGFCNDLKRNTGREKITLYVLGLAPEEKYARRQWMLSAMRAEVVAKYLRTYISSMFGTQNQSSVFGPPPKWSVYSWGAGKGGDWVTRESPIYENSHIMIAILR
jgi:outer membrane protein OmpA-like peptidoglycan-associated protein